MMAWYSRARSSLSNSIMRLRLILVSSFIIDCGLGDDVRPVRGRVKSQSREREMTDVGSGDEGWRRADLFPHLNPLPNPLLCPHWRFASGLSRGERGRESEQDR